MSKRSRLRKRWILLLIYLLVLGASHLYRGGQADHGQAQAGAKHQTLTLREGAATLEGELSCAYRDLVPEGRPEAPVLLLLHGSPMASESFNSLLPLLTPHYRLIVPDLPGFGGSAHSIPDYSILAHAHYVRELADKLKLESYHLLGYSMGGGPAIHLAAELDTERVRSLTLLSAIGVQELELTGDYTLNHAIHGLQLFGLTLIAEGTPHFGLLDHVLLNTRYARNFYDSDQRPLRALLEQIEQPALISHGEVDVLVPVEAAHEHARLLPQAELALHEGGHIIPITEPDRIAPDLLAFLERMEAGEGNVRGSLPMAEPPPPDKEGDYNLFLLVCIALATLVSEDLTCLAAGMLVARGALAFWPAALACFLGILIGDVLLFLVGKWLGPRALRRAPLRWFFSPEAVRHAAHWLNRRGMLLIFSARFLPGMRLPTYFAAGMLGTQTSRFLLAFVAAGLLWTPGLVALAWLVGDSASSWLEHYEQYALPILLGLILSLLLGSRLLLPLLTWRGRRLALSWWRRQSRWEFWPRWRFYLPVCSYIFGYLAIRHRSWTLAALANPAMPLSGLIHESKIDILRDLDRASPNAVAPFRVLNAGGSPEARKRRLLELAEELNAEQALPVVLKPEFGARGTGVHIVRQPDQLEPVLAELAEGRAIVQAYTPGLEFGLFYLRYPGQERGELFSITHKHYTTVTGDGKHTLEELILRDDRAVCQAPLHLKNLAKRLDELPAEGEEVPLIDIGTHSRGCLFLDGGEHATEALREALDRIARPYEGFHLGRFDIKVPSIEDLRNGRNLRVLELNGLTSEATHIYQPGHSLAYGLSTICRQWKHAYAIGAAHRRAGLKAPSSWRVIRQLFGPSA